MEFERSQLAVYFIMGSNNCEMANPLTVLEDALKGGITMFQFREKGDNAKKDLEKRVLAEVMQRLCKEYQVPFVVNDDLDLALEIGADGVHVGQDDVSVEAIRSVCPEKFFIGVSATNEQEAVKAVEDGADYIGVGPIFATNTKADAKKPINLAGIKRIRRLVGETPIVAIGGIKQADVASIVSSGADGVSVISAISLAPSPEQATREMKYMVNKNK